MGADGLNGDGRAETCHDALGWHSRLGRFDSYPFPHHSVTVIHEAWPCDIDVHHRFPGFLSSPGPVFDALWARRVSIPMAGQHIDIPDFSSSVLIMVLHSARSSTDNPATRKSSPT